MTQQIWKDGEKIPTQRLVQIFRQPPGLPDRFDRSAFVIGAKGAGKTTLFRYQKAVHTGVALHISLASEFASIARQAAIGPLTFEFTVALERQIERKAAALLCLAVAARLFKRGIDPPLGNVAQCLPKGTRRKLGTSELEILDCKSEVAAADLSTFEQIAYHSPLRDAFAEFGQAASERHGDLLLLLDRADTVPAPALVPILQLMDQSDEYTLLVATRAGHGAFTLPRLQADIVPGDQYDLHYLGLRPYDQVWRDFVAEAIRAQIDNNRTISHLDQKLVMLLGRDSIRLPLDILAHARDSASLLEMLEAERDTQIDAVDEVIHGYHPRFRSMLRASREELVATGSVARPFVIEFEGDSRSPVFQTQPRLAALIETGLRHGGLCMPTGDRWRPGSVPLRVEIPPLFLWRRNDNLEDLAESATFRRQYSVREFFALRTRREMQVPSVFVAYRWNINESKQFVTDLAKTLAAHPTLTGWQVTTGHTVAGVAWPETIRSRVHAAKIVVADVTGVRPDVMFELGFAYGLGRAIIPVVDVRDRAYSVPYWLRGLQLGYYKTQGDLLGIVSSIETQVMDPAYGRRWRPPQKVPGLAVWLGANEWSETAREQFQHQCTKNGMRVELMDPADANDASIRRAGSAALLVINLDGTEKDALMHYVAGAVVAKPRAAPVGRTVDRRVVVLEAPGEAEAAFCADSLRRCGGTIRLVRVHAMHSTVTTFLEAYVRWANA